MRPNVSQRLQGRHVVIEEYDPYIDDIDAMLDSEFSTYTRHIAPSIVLL